VCASDEVLLFRQTSIAMGRIPFVSARLKERFMRANLMIGHDMFNRGDRCHDCGHVVLAAK